MATTRLKLVFAGTPEFAAQHLRFLLDSGQHDIVAVYTQPDRPAGRGKKPRPSPVKNIALEQGLPVYQPLNFKAEEDRQALAALGADLMVVVAYGLILPQSVLDIPRLGCVNVHASLLPRWRGAAPIQRAIEAGDSESGVTIMQMAAGLDTGDMLRKVSCAITANDTAASLHDRLADMGGPALLETLNSLADGTAVAESQDDTLSNYAAKIDKQEAILDWRKPATQLDREIRAFIPFPICYTTLGEDRLRVWQALPQDNSPGAATPGTIIHTDKQGITVACGEGTLLLQALQLPGARQLSVAEILNGHAARFSPGTVLGSQ